HSAQADWQALQPMHFDTSMSFATSVWRSAGGVTFDADRLMRSLSPKRGCCGVTSGLGTGGNISNPSYATGALERSILTRNALNSGVSMFASPTKGVSELGPKPLRAAPMKPQWSGMPTTCTVLPSQMSGLMRLVTTALALTEPRFDHTRTQSPLAMPFSFASSSEISTKNSGCRTAFTWTCLVQ